MSQANLSEMIDRAIVDLISEQVIAALQRYQKRIVVLFTGNDEGVFVQALPQLQTLVQQGYSLSLLFSYSARTILKRHQAAIAALSPEHIIQAGEQNAEECHRLINQSHLLLLPELSLNTLAKSALGIGDSLPSQVIAYALMQGKPIIASHHFSENNAIPPAYAANIKQHIAQLQAYGVRFIKPGELACSIDAKTQWVTTTIGRSVPLSRIIHQPVQQQKRLISLHDVLLHDPSRALYLAPNVLLTPAARDEIKKRKIQLINSKGDEYVSR